MTSTPIDRIRDWIEGRLSAVEVERVEREVALDPELAAFAEDYRAVHRMTALLAADTQIAGPRARAPDGVRATPERSDASLQPRPAETSPAARRSSSLRRVAAILLVIGTAAVGALAWRTWRLSLPVRLEAIPLSLAASEEPDGSEAVEDPPDFLADYAPVENGAIRWLSDPDEARRAARAIGRPLFVFGFLQLCPWCVRMKQEALQDESVLALVERTLPVGIDLGAAVPAFAGALMERGYPFLEIDAGDGRAPYEFHGMHATEAFRAHLDAGLARLSAETPALAWAEVRQLAAILAGARSAERERHFAEALQGFDELAHAAPGSSYAAAGRRGVRRIAAAARDALLAARELAVRDPEAARALLRNAGTALAGTRYAHDLAAVLARFEELGRFPELVAASG